MQTALLRVRREGTLVLASAHLTAMRPQQTVTTNCYGRTATLVFDEFLGSLLLFHIAHTRARPKQHLSTALGTHTLWDAL